MIKATHLPHYPSASSLAFHAGRLYVTGDDAPYLLVLDSDHSPVDSLLLFDSPFKRIPRSTKADLESSAIITRNDTTFLYLFSSFSTPVRNRILSIAIGNKKPQLARNSTGSLTLADRSVNIEGAALVQNRLLLSNRANTTTTMNQLLITQLMNDTISSNDVKIISLLLPGIEKTAGLSGLHYIAARDLLLFSASTEDTPNAYTDGPVGESYIGYIARFSTRWNAESLSPDILIPLSSCLKQSLPQKIESITAEEEDGSTLTLHLAADNDNGESMLYKLRWKL